MGRALIGGAESFLGGPVLGRVLSSEWSFLGGPVLRILPGEGSFLRASGSGGIWWPAHPTLVSQLHPLLLQRCLEWGFIQV